MPFQPFDLEGHNAFYERMRWHHDPETCNCVGHLNDLPLRKPRDPSQPNHPDDELPDSKQMGDGTKIN
jgi:hypothetical protein